MVMESTYNFLLQKFFNFYIFILYIHILTYPRIRSFTKNDVSPYPHIAYPYPYPLTYLLATVDKRCHVGVEVYNLDSGYSWRLGGIRA
jgi:hypothetical protein